MGEEKRSPKRCLAYVAAFLVFQIVVITIFALTVMKIKSPKVRFDAMVVESFSSSNATSTSINMSLHAELVVKNTNFGHFKYDSSRVVILHNGVPQGEAAIPGGRVRAKKSSKFEIVAEVRINGGSNDLNSGRLRLTSQAKLEGKVELMKLIKKNKSGQMDCQWDINLATRQVENLNCN